MEYLDHDLLSRLGNLPFEVRQSMAGNMSGRHRSAQRGSSVEFASYRKYVPGDDTRRLDWKAYARFDRYYIKEYEADTNLRAYCVIDASGSMQFTSNGEISKYERSCRLATNLSYLLMKQGDSVGLSLCGKGELNVNIPPSRKPAQLNLMMEILQKMIPSGETTLIENLHILAEKNPRRGLIMVFSDLFINTDEWKEVIRHLRYRKHDVVVFHLIDRVESLLNIDHPTKFIGLEGDQSVIADPSLIRGEYKRIIEKYIVSMKQTCMDSLVDYRLISEKNVWQDVLTSFLMDRLKKGRE
ncbi:MAG: DUF58 domain-containing protein [Akkermansia sp.]